MKRYKAVFHSGAEVDLQTKALKGVAELGASGLKVFGNESRTEIPAQSILDASLQAIPGGGHMVKVERAQGTLFVGAREFMVGQLASFNSQETRDLLEGVLLLAERNRPSSQR